MEGVSEQLCIRMKNDLSLFRFLSEADLRELPCYFEQKHVAAGDALCEEGGTCDYVAFIISGQLEIRKDTEFTGKQVILGVYSRGSIVGELCILEDVPRAVTAVALEDTALIVLRKEMFDRLIEEHPAIGAKFLKGILLVVSRRLRKSFERLAEVF